MSAEPARAGGEAAAAFEQAFSEHTVVESARPLHLSSVWAINSGFWEQTGPGAFAGGTQRDCVPYQATSDGSLSLATAALLLATARLWAADRGPCTRLVLVELGPGSGLFARITAQCWERERANDASLPPLHYLGIDTSASMLQAIKARGLLDISGISADVVQLDLSADPEALAAVLRERCADEAPVLVVANYLLDSLPAMLLVRRQGAIEETWVELRTHGDASARLDDSRRLPRCTARPADPQDRFVALAAPFLTADGWQLGVNRAAVGVIEAIAGALGRKAMLLINDYAAEAQAAGSPPWQHFAGSMAMGLHFATLDAFVSGSLQWSAWAPLGSDTPVVARLLADRPAPAITEAFQRAFAHVRVREAQAQVASARAAQAQGRLGDAAAAFEAAVTSVPDNWSIVTEAAAFVLTGLGKPDAAARLAKVALHANPLCAPAWNVLGDCAYRNDDFLAAAQAYEAANKAAGGDARALLNLAYCASRQQRPADALQFIARALLADADGPLTPEILRRQAEIVGRLGAGAVRAAS